MSLPRIPEVKFVATKGSEVEEFISYKDFEEWAMDECDRELADFWKYTLCSDGRRGIDGYREYVKDWMPANELIEFVEEKGWEVKRVAYDLSNESVKGC